MKRTGAFLLLLFSVLTLLAVALSAQQGRAQPASKRDTLAVFAFTGGSVSDGEAIASSLTRQPVLRSAFRRTTLITRATIQSMGFEQRFQRNAGLTDADTIFELGRQLNASHVIAGYITRLGDRNLVVVGIMDVESLQQIAGAYQDYTSIEEIDRFIAGMAKTLSDGAMRDTSRLPGLSVPPFTLATGVNQRDSMVLAQILACDLANGNRYAVLPRTDSIDKVLAEHRRQRSGTTDQDRIRRLGEGRNARHVLSGSVQRLGNLNKLATDILDIESGDFIEGYEESYGTLSEGVNVMPRLAAQLLGTRVGARPPATRPAAEPRSRPEPRPRVEPEGPSRPTRR
jgi:TolB-like protein